MSADSDMQQDRTAEPAAENIPGFLKNAARFGAMRRHGIPRTVGQGWGDAFAKRGFAQRRTPEAWNA